MKDTILWDMYPVHKETLVSCGLAHSFRKNKDMQMNTTLGVLSCDSLEWEISGKQKEKVSNF